MKSNFTKTMELARAAKSLHDILYYRAGPPGSGKEIIITVNDTEVAAALRERLQKIYGLTK